MRKVMIAILLLVTIGLRINASDLEIEIPYIKDGINVDAEIGDWPDFVEPIKIPSTEEQIESIPWNREEDLSAEVYIGWNEQGILFACKVLDDLHSQPFQNALTWNQIWSGDSVQVAFDPLKKKTVGRYIGSEYEYGLALLNKGPIVWVWQAAQKSMLGKNETVSVAIKRDEDQNETIYEALISWSDLAPLTASEGAKIGFSMLVNDNDGQGRKGWIELTPGIGTGKDPSQFAVLVLQKRGVQQPKLELDPNLTQLSVDTNTVINEFKQYKDVSQGGIKDVLETQYWASMAPWLQKIDSKLIRLDHVFDDSYYDVVTRKNGQLHFNWERLDKILNEIFAMGAQPFFSLSYMPMALAKDKENGPYGPPSDYLEWQKLCNELVKHMKVKWNSSGLYYEIWNEPDLSGFWKGTREEYFELYRYGSLGISEADPTAKIGGGGFAGLTWLQPFLQFVSDRKLVLDFYSWHNYNFEPESYRGQIQSVKNYLLKFGFTQTETIYSEWNINGLCAVDNDSFYNAGYAAAVTKIFTEENLSKGLFFMAKDEKRDPELFGQWGFLTNRNNPKPVYNFFDVYSRLRGDLVHFDTSNRAIDGFAVKDGETLRILIYSYGLQMEFGDPQTCLLSIELDPSAVGKLYQKDIYIIDSKHSNVSVNPREAGVELVQSEEILATKNKLTLNFSIENGGVIFIELSLKS